jgi:hypothetical protein
MYDWMSTRQCPYSSGSKLQVFNSTCFVPNNDYDNKKDPKRNVHAAPELWRQKRFDVVYLTSELKDVVGIKDSRCKYGQLRLIFSVPTLMETGVSGFVVMTPYVSIPVLEVTQSRQEIIDFATTHFDYVQECESKYVVTTVDNIRGQAQMAPVYGLSDSEHTSGAMPVQPEFRPDRCFVANPFVYSPACSSINDLDRFRMDPAMRTDY